MRTVCKLGKCPEFCAGRRLSSAWPRTLGAGCNVSQPTRSSAAFDRAVARLIDEPPHTVMHGDAHTGNVYFRNGAAGLLDWQVRRGHPGRELAYRWSPA